MLNTDKTPTPTKEKLNRLQAQTVLQSAKSMIARVRPVPWTIEDTRRIVMAGGPEADHLLALCLIANDLSDHLSAALNAPRVLLVCPTCEEEQDVE